MAKKLSKTFLYIGQGDPDTTTPAADTFDKFSNLITTSGPEFEKDDIEHTDMDSTLKEFFGDLANPGNFAFTANRNYGDAGQSAARTLVQGQSQKNIRVTRIDPDDDSVLETVDFRGEVMQWSEEFSQGQAAQITGRIKISNTVTYS